jgi:hypothetical protein
VRRVGRDQVGVTGGWASAGKGEMVDIYCVAKAGCPAEHLRSSSEQTSRGAETGESACCEDFATNNKADGNTQGIVSDAQSMIQTVLNIALLRLQRFLLSRFVSVSPSPSSLRMNFCGGSYLKS